jgi:hypothetical protein
MKRFVYKQLLPITALLVCFSVPVQAASITINNITTVITDITDAAPSSDTCDEKKRSSLQFVLNDKVIEEDLMLTPILFELGDKFSVELVEDIRVCSRKHRVDLWVGIKLPGGEEIFMIRTKVFPFFGFSAKGQPFMSDLESSNDDPITSVLSHFEVQEGMNGDYDFYAAYTKTGAKIGSLLFTLRSNRPSVKIVLGR